MQNLIAIAVGGAAGALCRYGVNVMCVRWLAVHPAWGTIAVNVAGSLLLGILAGTRLAHSTFANAILGIGFLGALTTFSTFSLETVRMLDSGKTELAAINVAASVSLGLASIFAGLQIGRLLPL